MFLFSKEDSIDFSCRQTNAKGKTKTKTKKQKEQRHPDFQSGHPNSTTGA